MVGALTIAQMQANVLLSQSHVERQKIIISRLTDQGHESMAADAQQVLMTMHAHLALEVEMLARMEDDLRQV